MGSAMTLAAHVISCPAGRDRRRDRLLTRMADTRFVLRGLDRLAWAGSRRSEPVTVGVPFPRGLLATPADLRLSTPAGEDQPVQVTALDRWHDGSVRWALLDFQADSVDGVVGACEVQAPLRSAHSHHRRRSRDADPGGRRGRNRCGDVPVFRRRRLSVCRGVGRRGVADRRGPVGPVDRRGRRPGDRTDRRGHRARRGSAARRGRADRPSRRRPGGLGAGRLGPGRDLRRRRHGPRRRSRSAIGAGRCTVAASGRSATRAPSFFASPRCASRPAPSGASGARSNPGRR